MAAENGKVFHCSEVKDAACLVTCRGSKEVASSGLEFGFCYSVFVTMEGGEAAGRAGVPEFDKMVF